MTINCQILGNLGADAELKEHDGNQYLNFNVASNHYTRKDEVTWIRCALWGSRAEKLEQYLTKGTRVLVVGTLSTRENDEGKTFLNCHATSVSFAGSSRGDDEERDKRRSNGGKRNERKPASQDRKPSRSRNDEPPANDDDIPF